MDNKAELTASRVATAVEAYLQKADPLLLLDPVDFRNWVYGLAMLSVHAATPVVWQAATDTVVEILTTGKVNDELQTTREAAAEVGRWIGEWSRTDGEGFLE